MTNTTENQHRTKAISLSRKLRRITRRLLLDLIEQDNVSNVAPTTSSVSVSMISRNISSYHRPPLTSITIQEDKNEDGSSDASDSQDQDDVVLDDDDHDDADADLDDESSNEGSASWTSRSQKNSFQENAATAESELSNALAHISITCKAY